MATAAGSAPDVIARIVTDRLSQIWGQQVLILNRPGAGGLIAMQALAAAERDDHTLYLPSSSSLVVLPETNSKLPLDIERDLVPIGLVGEQPFMIVAGNHVGVNTLPELIALAKSKPGELTYAANFRGSLPNMTGEMFASRAGIKMTFVPYPGAPQGLQDVMGGRISAMVEGLAAFTGPMQSNSVKPLGGHLAEAAAELSRPADRRRKPLPGFNSRGWFVFLAPPARRTTWCARSTRTCARCSIMPEVRSAVRRRCATYVRHLSPAETGEFIRAEQAGLAAGGQAGRRRDASRRRETKRAPLGRPLHCMTRAGYLRREIGM